MIAHVGGIPVEELIPAAAGAGMTSLLARAWVVALPVPLTRWVRT